MAVRPAQFQQKRDLFRQPTQIQMARQERREVERQQARIDANRQWEIDAEAAGKYLLGKIKGLNQHQSILLPDLKLPEAEYMAALDKWHEDVRMVMWYIKTMVHPNPNGPRYKWTNLANRWFVMMTREGRTAA